jgi:hypothetical protein
MTARLRCTFLLSAACAAGLGASHCFAAASLPADPDGYSLQPGEFTWLSDARESGASPVTLLVSLRDQRGYLYRDGQRIAVTTVSTGTPGHDTPTGVFPIINKQPVYHSKKYDNAAMPWMQRLTMWGHALHAGHVRAGPASHGCVRLPAAFARELYSLTRTGDLVVISEDTSAGSLARAAEASRSVVMMEGAPAGPARIDEALRALGQPESGMGTPVGPASLSSY